MNLSRLLAQRTATDGPIRVGVIGAGKFSGMFLTQALTSPGMHVLGVADLDVPRASATLERTGWPAERFAAPSLDDARKSGGTCVTDDALALIDCAQVEVIVEITGDPGAGARHALRGIEAGKHVVMVNVEADCLVGPLLWQKAQAAGVVYSMAYGDQPALICELVDWCRTAGYTVVSAGKGTKFLPEYHGSTPDTVWDHYGFTEEQLRGGDFNPKMFNSFLDGTKSAIEMAAVANGTGLIPQDEGLQFPPAGTHELADVFAPRDDGGVLSRSGTVEVASSLQRDGDAVANDLRWGVFVSFEAQTDYAARCFAEYGVPTNAGGRIAALYRPFHLIGMELGVSIASAVLRGEPTGESRVFNGDVMSVTKTALRAGDTLDGEGGYTVYGRLSPAARSLENGALPIGLAHGVKLRRDLEAGAIVRWSDVELPANEPLVRLRRELERTAGVGA